MAAARHGTFKAQTGRRGRRLRSAIVPFPALALTVLALTALGSGRAHAQLLLDQYLSADIPGVGIEPGVTVLSRRRPEYDPLGVRVGEVTILAQLLETFGFDDNVLGRATKKGSAVIESNAQVQGLYDHSDTRGFVTLNVDDNRFPQQDAQSFTNWSASIGGSHTFDRDILSASYTHLNLNQTVRDLDVPLLDQALPFRVDAFRIDYRAQFSRVFIDPGLNVSSYNYSDGTVGGVPYLQGYRDRVVVEPNLTIGYELAPRESIVLVFRDDIGSYSNHTAGSVVRDFNDFAVLGGLDFEAGGIWRYRLLAGYETRQFTSSQIKSISEPVVEAEAIWNPSGRTTLTGSATRHVQDSANENTVGFTETALGLQVDHEVRRNVLVQAKASYLLDNYSQGGGSQDLYDARGAATWLLNRNMALVASYEFTHRISSGSGNLGILIGQAFSPTFSENRYLLQLRLAL